MTVEITPALLDEIERSIADDPAEVRFEGADTIRALVALARERLASAATIAADKAEIARLRGEVTRLCCDREYIVGWTAGFDHAVETLANLQFPTALRKMWSGGEVQDWLNRAVKEARAALKEGGQP
jgi:hypothetical protein